MMLGRCVAFNHHAMQRTTKPKDARKSRANEPFCKNEYFVAQFFGVSVGTVRRWRHQGRGPLFLQHHLGNPNAVRIVSFPPGQVSAVPVVPAEKIAAQVPFPCQNHDGYFCSKAVILSTMIRLRLDISVCAVCLPFIASL